MLTISLLPACTALLLLTLPGTAATQTETPNERILFFGDSITQLGEEPGGYVQLVRDSLQKTAPGGQIEVIGAGISGNRVPDLIARVDRDVIDKSPSLVVIYVGINDVWHQQLFNRGTPLPEFQEGLTSLVQKITAAGARVILCTPTVIGEKPNGLNALDRQLDSYADATRIVAGDMQVPLCDLRSACLAYLRQHNPEQRERGILTTDGVHLNAEGNHLVAEAMLGALARGGLRHP